MQLNLIDFGVFWFGTDQDDFIKTGDADDVAYGYAGHDNFILEGGDDTAYGGDGNDSMQGLVGDDALFGGNGRDALFGQGDDDKLYGGADADKLYGGQGFDELFGGTGNDHLEGGADDDRLFGGDGVDGLYGGDGSDVIQGGAGIDHIFGGQNGPGGTGDVMTGGADMDVFYFFHGDSGNGGAIDVITDFTQGEDLLAIDADPATFLGLNGTFSETPGAEIYFEHTSLQGFGEVTMVHVRDQFGFGADNSIALQGHMHLTEADFFVF